MVTVNCDNCGKLITIAMDGSYAEVVWRMHRQGLCMEGVA